MTHWQIGLAIYCTLSAAICLVQLGRDMTKGNAEGINLIGVAIIASLSPVLVWLAIGHMIEAGAKARKGP